MNNPATAPGRETSSPWPDRIEVVDIAQQPNGTITARALLIWMTSEEVAHGGNAGTSTLALTSYETARTTAPNATLQESDLPQKE